MNNKKILISGINGFVGSNFLKILKELSPNSDVYGIDKKFNDNKNYTPIKCDLTEKEPVKSMLSRLSPDYIFHFAGTAYDKDWNKLYDSNVKSTISLFESVVESGLNPRIIVIGSASEYGNIPQELLPVQETIMSNPASLYGASMSCRTNIAMAFRMMDCDIIIGRVFNTIGPGVTDRTPVGSFARQVSEIEKGLHEPAIHAGNLSPERDFIDIEDVARAFYCLATKTTCGGIYNICSGKPISISTILDIYSELSNQKFNIIADNALIRQNDIAVIYGDNRKIRSETGWRPKIGLRESLKRTLDFYRKA